MIGLFYTLIAMLGALVYQRRYRHMPPDWQAELIRRLQSFAAHTHQCSEFYRQQWDQAGVAPERIQSLEDFRRLPVIDRDVWRALPAAALNPSPRVVYRRTTGGTSSGTPVSIPFTLRDELRLRMLVYSVRFYHGVRWYDRVLSLVPPDPRYMEPHGPRWSLIVPAPLGSPQHVEALSRRRSGVLIGSAVILWGAVIRARRTGTRLPRQRVVQTGGEVLTHTMRRVLEQTFSAPVRQIFGGTDWGRMAFDCDHGHLHVSPEASHVEILCGDRPAAPGEVGEMVVTNFLTHARPLVRVRTGDFAAWADQPCSCGSPLPYIAYVSGRQYDRVIAPDGRIVYWPDVEHALEPWLFNVLGYQVQQIDASHVIVRLSLDTPPDSLAAYQHALEALFDGMTVEIALTDALASEASGKTRIVIGLPTAEHIPA